MQRLTLPTSYWHCCFCVLLLSLIFQTEKKNRNKEEKHCSSEGFSHLLDLHPQKRCPMEAAGVKMFFSGQKSDLKWDVSKGVLAKRTRIMSSSQWDLIRRVLGSWETSCMV